MSSKRNPIKNRDRKEAKSVTLAWKITADNVNGSQPGLTSFHAKEGPARREADWLHAQPGLTRVVLEGPKIVREVAYHPTPEDVRLGAWLSAALDDPKVSPCMKYDINLWMDSKHWWKV
ncbi:hypothetical protein uan_108 [Pseudomonas phage UAntarctica]|nr:hypothetical protein uan_108 [Pseudomonas phage UAntarctica]